MSDNKVKKAVLDQFGEIIAFVNVEKNVRRVRVCRNTAGGSPVNAYNCKVTAAKKVLNSRKAQESEALFARKELPCGTFLI